MLAVARDNPKLLFVQSSRRAAEAAGLISVGSFATIFRRRLMSGKVISEMKNGEILAVTMCPLH